jgi:PhoPQ-activated pathogenicity-related protein
MNTHCSRLVRRAWAGLAALCFLAAIADELPRRTALDDYLEQVDPAYEWRVVSSTEDDGLRTVVVDMVSQRWLTDAEVDRTEWRHWLTLSIPADLRSETALLYIDGGRNANY